MQRLLGMFPQAAGSPDNPQESPSSIRVFGNLSQRTISRRISPEQPSPAPLPSVEQIATILDLLPIANCITDFDGMISHVNKPFGFLFGESSESGKGGRNVFDVISSTSADKLYSCIVNIQSGKSTNETGIYVSRRVNGGKSELRNCIWTIAQIPGSRSLLVSIRVINDHCGDLSNEEGEVYSQLQMSNLWRASLLGRRSSSKKAFRSSVISSNTKGIIAKMERKTRDGVKTSTCLREEDNIKKMTTLLIQPRSL